MSTPKYSVATLKTPSAGWLLLILAIWLGFLAWARVLTLPDEGRYAGVAWEMLRSGSYAVPLLDGMPYFHKPPLYYWLAQFSFSLFGLNEWAARLPSLLAAWATLSGLYFFIRRYRNAETATIAVLILATTPFFYGGAQFANTDMMVASLISLSVLAGAHTVLQAANHQAFRWMAIATGALTGLAVLAKGLIGLVLPAAILGLWLMLTKRWRGFLVLLWPPVIIAFVLVAAPWFLLMQWRYPEFFNYFFVYQHFERFAQTGFNNVQPFWFYIPVIICLTLPWSLWGGSALRKDFWRSADPTGLRCLMAVWIAVIIGFFSIPSSKLIGYVVPALPPFAALLAEIINKVVTQQPNNGKVRFVRWCAIGSAVLCIALVVFFVSRPRQTAEPLASQIATELRADDTIVALNSYPFDLGIYTKSTKPIWVIDDWNSPKIPLRDNWRKELYDAGKFDPKAAENSLITNEQFLPRLCASPIGSRFWIWGGLKDGSRYPALRNLEARFVDRHHKVWLLTIDQAFTSQVCGETPKTDLPQK